MTNEDRALMALTALQTDPDFRPYGNDMQTTVVDLLANLMHLADLEGLDFDDLAASAKMHHTTEVDEEHPEPQPTQAIEHLQRLLSVAELNMDDMEPETRVVVRNASAFVTQFV